MLLKLVFSIHLIFSLIQVHPLGRLSRNKYLPQAEMEKAAVGLALLLCYSTSLALHVKVGQGGKIKGHQVGHVMQLAPFVTGGHNVDTNH